jgi:hypothetical protein
MWHLVYVIVWQVYAMQVADTVVVTESGKTPEVATASCPKTFDKVSYRLNVSGVQEVPYALVCMLCDSKGFL